VKALLKGVDVRAEDMGWMIDACESEKRTSESESVNEDGRSWYAWPYEAKESENGHQSEVAQDVAQEPFEILAEAGEMIRALWSHAEKSEWRTNCEMKVLCQVQWVFLA
jgi:hypothetical protein